MQLKLPTLVLRKQRRVHIDVLRGDVGTGASCECVQHWLRFRRKLNGRVVKVLLCSADAATHARGTGLRTRKHVQSAARFDHSGALGFRLQALQLALVYASHLWHWRRIRLAARVLHTDTVTNIERSD